MNRFSAIAFAVMLVILTIAGCSGKKAEEEAVKAVIVNNLQALQEENVQKYLDTLHPESPGYAKMEQICPQIFQMYDLRHKLLDIKVLSLSDDEAKVRTVQEAIRISGPENYHSNRSTMVHTLRKYKGQWKLFNTDQESSEEIE